MKLPDFIIVGAQKAGTTAMHYSLANHDKVYVSEPKELNFFNEDENYAKGIEWYAAHFDGCPNESIAGEGTPEYMYDPSAAERMSRIVPNAKLIIMLRNPVDRAYSAYWHAVRYGYEDLSFEKAIDQEAERLQRSAVYRRYNSYIDRGHYAKQILRIYEYYDRSQVHVVISEEYFSDQRSVLSNVATFLGIDVSNDAMLAKAPRAKNVAKIPRLFGLQRAIPHLERGFPIAAKMLSRINLKEKPYQGMDLRTRAYLLSLYSESNRELEEVLKIKINQWAS